MPIAVAFQPPDFSWLQAPGDMSWSVYPQQPGFVAEAAQLSRAAASIVSGNQLHLSLIALHKVPVSPQFNFSLMVRLYREAPMQVN